MTFVIYRDYKWTCIGMCEKRHYRGRRGTRDQWGHMMLKVKEVEFKTKREANKFYNDYCERYLRYARL
jgi:hypothetical protein